MPPRSLQDWEKNRSYPTVSLVVLNYKNVDATLRCLESLERMIYAGQIQLLVVENGSHDDSADRLAAYRRDRRPDCGLVTNAVNRGFAGGVLSAWEKARGDLVLLLNNDTVVHPDFLTRLVDGFRGRTDLGAVWPADAPLAWAAELASYGAGEVAALKNGTQNVLGSNIWLPILKDFRQCFTASGVCLLFPRHLVEAPFPEEYFAYYEDVFFGWRLRLRGLALERVPESTIYHAGGATTVKVPALRKSLMFHQEKNRLANFLIFYSGTTLVRLLPYVAVDELKKLAHALALLLRHPRAGVRYVVINFSARLWILRHLGFIKRWRKQVARERTVADGKLTPLMSSRLVMGDRGPHKLLNGVGALLCRLGGIATVETTPPARQRN